MSASRKPAPQPSHETLHVLKGGKSKKAASPTLFTAMSRDARMSQIERVIAIHQMQKNAPMTMRQIARELCMSASNHLMLILWDMVDAGRLVSNPRQYRANMTAWDFKVPPRALASVLEDIYEAVK